MRHHRYTYAFLTLFVFPLVLIPSIGSRLIDANASSTSFDIFKTIYVDFSLNEKFKIAGKTSLFCYFDGKSHEVELISDAHDIYHSASSIPISADHYLYFSDGHGYESERISFDSKIRENYIDYICLDVYQEGKTASIKGYGLFVDAKANDDATYATQRIWLYNPNEHGFYENDDWNTPCKNAVSYLDNGKWKVTIMDYAVNNYDGKTYHFVDIPCEVTDVHFLRLSLGKYHGYLHYLEASIPLLSYGSCYQAGNASYEDFMNISRISVQGANASILGKVVEAFITYGKHPSNGPTTSTIQNVYSTWFENKSANIDDLKDQKILDYTGYAANGNSYEGLVKTVPYSVSEKWNGLCSQASVDPNNGQVKSSFFNFSLSGIKIPLFIGGSVFVALLFLEVIVLIVRRKHDRV